MLYTNIDVAETLCKINGAGLTSDNQRLEWFSRTLNRDDNRRRPYIISIDGNIGAGKSTLIEKLQKIYETGTLDEKRATFGKFADEKMLFMKEPVELWTSIRDPVTGESILEMFYKDPQKYSFAFQVMVYNTHLDAFRRILRENPDCTLLFCERSIDA
jgi:deoxyadenosine/deoxycytidine kinase